MAEFDLDWSFTVVSCVCTSLLCYRKLFAISCKTDPKYIVDQLSFVKLCNRNLRVSLNHESQLATRMGDSAKREEPFRVLHVVAVMSAKPETLGAPAEAPFCALRIARASRGSTASSRCQCGVWGVPTVSCARAEHPS